MYFTGFLFNTCTIQQAPAPTSHPLPSYPQILCGSNIIKMELFMFGEGRYSCSSFLKYRSSLVLLLSRQDTYITANNDRANLVGLLTKEEMLTFMCFVPIRRFL